VTCGISVQTKLDFSGLVRAQSRPHCIVLSSLLHHARHLLHVAQRKDEAQRPARDHQLCGRIRGCPDTAPRRASIEQDLRAAASQAYERRLSVAQLQDLSAIASAFLSPSFAGRSANRPAHHSGSRHQAAISSCRRHVLVGLRQCPQGDGHDTDGRASRLGFGLAITPGPWLHQGDHRAV
jgi:hypothetical protein